MSDQAVLARRLIGLLDLTNLELSCGPADIKALCARAVGPHGPVAAVCVWPQHVGEVDRILADTPVRIATVMNFPSGTGDLETVLSDMEEALDDGADEIDLVFPYRDFLAGDEAAAAEMVREARGLLRGNQHLKVILETGALPDLAAVSRASALAIAAGADFLKTSTGKIAVSATPEASRVMLEAIRDSGRPVGFKAAGGIRTLADASLYVGLAETVMGSGWATPATFRIGASSLHAALVAAIEGAGPASAPQGY